MEKRVHISLCMGMLMMFGCAVSDGISNIFWKTRTRLAMLDHSLELWSGVANNIIRCSSLCAAEPQCASLLYNETDKSCKMFNVLHQVEESTEELDYYIIERANNQTEMQNASNQTKIQNANNQTEIQNANNQTEIQNANNQTEIQNANNQTEIQNATSQNLPASCADIVACSGTNTDGEYWLYPNVTNGQRIKVYCHNMGTNPAEYITLKHANTFVQHDMSNWGPSGADCQRNYTPPLKQANFTKIAIDIQDLVINQTDYTFADLTGDFDIGFGETTDCSSMFKPADIQECYYFGDAVINTSGTGMILDPNIQWGEIGGMAPAIRQFNRSADGCEISFKCVGFKGRCGPLGDHIKLVLTSESECIKSVMHAESQFHKEIEAEKHLQNQQQKLES